MKSTDHPGIRGFIKRYIDETIVTHTLIKFRPYNWDLNGPAPLKQQPAE